tara:strand:- start:291 stop:587 length:297 start_codon:yes stop_codon:yes gene_type:complete
MGSSLSQLWHCATQWPPTRSYAELQVNAFAAEEQVRASGPQGSAAATTKPTVVGLVASHLTDPLKNPLEYVTVHVSFTSVTPLQLAVKWFAASSSVQL